MKSICYESTKKCNLNCEYCITSDNKDSSESVNYEEIIKFIAGLNPERIVISGGEPLLDEDLINKLLMIKNMCKDSYISLSTNGSVNYNFVELKKYVDCIDISIPTLNNKLYTEMRGKDFVYQVKENIENVINLGINVRVSIMLSKINAQDLLELLDYAKKVSVNSVRIGRFLPLREAAKRREKYELSSEEIKKIMYNIYSRNYTFKIIPPIQDLSAMETGYITVNYLGEVFLPTSNGKVICGTLNDKFTNENIIKVQKDIFINMDNKNYLSKYFPTKRIRESTKEERVPLDEFYSDRSRILHSPYFRKMQQKAQVFSLETNSSIRSRLTHSLEVSDIGRRLAVRIAERLRKLGNDKNKINVSDEARLIAVIENACLIHDIGNPPFGHFGEEAIKEWWKEESKKYIKNYNKNAKKRKEEKLNFDTMEKEILLLDFEEFDGNPQGIRTILRLEDNNKDHEQNLESGLNLTYATILCAIKYVRTTGDSSKIKDIDDSIIKKCGYFKSEERIINKIYSETELEKNKRYLFTYVMEAADDLAYCLSDISDGIEKRILTPRDFYKEFQQAWKSKYIEDVPPKVLSEEIKGKLDENKINDFNIEVGFDWKIIIIDEIVDNFILNIDNYAKGNIGPIIQENQCEYSYKILEVIKYVSRKKIYRSPEAEEIELAGYSIISGLLNFFGKLLELTMDEFSIFLDESKASQIKNYDLEYRIFNRLSNCHINSYKKQLKEWNDEEGKKYGEQNIEWWLRTHLIIDHIAGMTDSLALQTYQVCKGIDLKIL
jgi:dGTPase